MALEFDGTKYRTISDVTKRFRVSAKTIEKRIKAGQVPEPAMIAIGTKRFRHYDDAWCKKFELAINAEAQRGKKPNGRG